MSMGSLVRGASARMSALSQGHAQHTIPRRIESIDTKVGNTRTCLAQEFALSTEVVTRGDPRKAVVGNNPQSVQYVC